MAYECVTLKLEPAEVSEGEENEASSASNQIEPEFISIKMETDVQVPNLSTKPNEEEGANSLVERRNSWHVPVTEETEINPANFIEVTVKEEPEEFYEEEAEADSLDLPSTSATKQLEDEDETTASIRGRYLCPVCKRAFANPGNVARHMLLHTNKTVECNVCHAEFVNTLRLERHIFNKHTTPNDRKYPCDECDKNFKSSSNLMQHKKTHLTVKPYKCPICYKTFSFKTNLKKHQGKSRCKKPTEEPIMCHICNKEFTKQYLLKSHLRRHDPDRSFGCDLCSAKFKYNSTLLRHQQLHNGAKPICCPVCNKTFTHSGLIKPHMRVHTGEKPYQCPICKQNFAHKHNMERHKVRHDKIKHLVCDVCHKEFPKESRLIYHMKTHVNEKYFACNICPKRFSHKQNVLRHYTRKHPGQTFSCTDTDASVALKVWDSIKSKYNEDEAEVILG